MKTWVITHNEIEGLHHWNDAPVPVNYLKNLHRHVFVIECQFKVKDADREIEIIMQQDKIENYITEKYGKPAMFGHMSCEMIAEDILNFFEGCTSCRVLEDGMGGALVSR